MLQDNVVELWELTAEDGNGVKDFPPKLLDSVKQDGDVTQMRVCILKLFMLSFI